MSETKLRKTSIPESGCVLPFLAADISSSGEYSLCCEAKPSQHYAKDLSTSNWFFGEEMTTTRAIIAANGLPVACSKCYKKESRGEDSMRLRSWRHFYDGTYGRVDDLVAHPSIRLFFYRFGNSRNLSCLMCNSNSSSAFGQEAAAIGEGGWKTISNSTGLSEDELKGIQVLYLGGGEPSMAKECLSLVDRLATLGNTQCAIVLNTNASLPKSPFFEKLKAFKYARVGFSIDGIGESYNLIRYPMLWNKLNDNICFLFTKYPKFNYEIWFTLNNLNLCEFPLFLDWWLNLCADSPQAHVQLNLSEVTHPEFLRPDLCSPSEVRRAMDAVAQFLTDPRVTVNRDRVESIRRASLMLSLLKENSKAADLISMRNQFIARRQEYRRVLPDVKI